MRELSIPNKTMSHWSTIPFSSISKRTAEGQD